MNLRFSDTQVLTHMDKMAEYSTARLMEEIQKQIGERFLR